MDPFYPIIYVRGYAMSQSEIDETTADPFCGFNIGSTVYRAGPDKGAPARKFVFESPVVRLASDFQYKDVFEDGIDFMDPAWTKSISKRSIIIYRYYEEASALLGQGKTPPIEEFARRLSDLVLKIRDLVTEDPANGLTKETFRCYLVAHSMGGLVCRAFLQNPELGAAEARRCVEKYFTYATPHNGIDMLGMNVPSWLTLDDMSNFNRERMASYLNLDGEFQKTQRVDWIPEKVFPSEKVFCMIGTNRSDYEVAAGLSRMFSGHGSDGLVRIENASVWGIDENGKVSKPCATAYTYRSHSGYFGIVNSEESYQNLIRFLFGSLRVDISVDIELICLPRDVQAQADAGKTVKGLYQFEILASPRGKRWYLTRRIAEEDSVACVSYEELPHAPAALPKSVYLSTLFLDRNQRVDKDNPSLSYCVTLGVRIPDYEVDHAFLPNTHYEGSYLFRDTLTVEIVPTGRDDGKWNVISYWQSEEGDPLRYGAVPVSFAGGSAELLVPFSNSAVPGIRGKVRFNAALWNV